VLALRVLSYHLATSSPLGRMLLVAGAVLIHSAAVRAQVCPASHYSLIFTNPTPISIAPNSDSAPQTVAFEGSALPTGCAVQIHPSSSTWSIIDPSIASLNSCTTSSTCTVHGVNLGQTNLLVSASSTYLGLFNLEKMKPVIVTTQQLPNQCLDSAGLVVPCGGGCIVSSNNSTSSSIPIRSSSIRSSAVTLTTTGSPSAPQILNACDPESTSVEIITSGDPNDKSGSQGVGAQQYVSGVTPLRYAVEFSNVPTASAPAQKVVVMDQLNTTTEDLTTLALGPIAVPDQLVVPPPGTGDFSTTVDLRPANNLLVAISTQFNASTGLLTWVFQSLDPATNQPPTDPTAGFLPPGTGGSVFFTVKAKATVSTGTQVQNQATVVFDANSPMDTPTWLNTIDNTSPTSHIVALPARSSCPAFRVGWSGSDVGSGLQGFSVYVSDDGGPFALWLSNTTASGATYMGSVGHTYSFYSIATDFTGNVEAAKTSAEATTMVSAGGSCGSPSLSGQVSNVSQSGTTMTVTLQLTNTSSTAGQALNINQVTVRTLAGSGTVTLTSPSIPATEGSLGIGASTNVTLIFDVPSTVTRFSITENGTLQDGAGNTYNYSIAQVVIA